MSDRQTREVQLYTVRSYEFRIQVVANDISEARHTATTWTQEVHGRVITEQAWTVQRSRSLIEGSPLITFDDLGGDQ